MIISFGNNDTEKIWDGERVKKLPIEIQGIGRRKLRMLNNSINLTDLKIPPSNKSVLAQRTHTSTFRVSLYCAIK